MHEFPITNAMLSLERLDLRGQSLNLLTRPVDRVDFLANDHLEPVGWSVGGFNPACSNGARLAVFDSVMSCGLWRVGILVDCGSICLHTRFGCQLDQFCLGSFQLEDNIFAFIDQFRELLGVCDQPDSLDLVVAIDAAYLGLIEDVGWDRREKHSLGRDPRGIQRAHEVSLAQVDEVQRFTSDHEEDEAWKESVAAQTSDRPEVWYELTNEDIREEDMGIESVAIVGHVAKGQHVQLLLAASASGIDGEQDGPGNQAAREADGRRNFEISKEEVGVERVVL